MSQNRKKKQNNRFAPNGPALSSHAERTGARSSFFQDGGGVVS